MFEVEIFAMARPKAHMIRYAVNVPFIRNCLNRANSLACVD